VAIEASSSRSINLWNGTAKRAVVELHPADSSSSSQRFAAGWPNNHRARAERLSVSACASRLVESVCHGPCLPVGPAPSTGFPPVRYDQIGQDAASMPRRLVK
jgi:hypothetical protein